MCQFSGFEALETRAFLSASPIISDAGADNAQHAALTIPILPRPGTGGVHLTEHAHQQFTAKLGEFHLKVIDLALSATVDWGDGKTSTGKIEGSYATGDWYVDGTHKYDHTGTYRVQVKIFTHLIGAPQLATSPAQQFTSIITVKKLAPSNGGFTLNETAGVKFNDKLGEIHLKVIDLALNAVINWGDGTHSDGKLVGSYATGEYYVFGKHTYAHAGNYAVDVSTFARPIGSPVQPTSPVVKFTALVKVTDKP
jgi:hypothetical protein